MPEKHQDTAEAEAQRMAQMWSQAHTVVKYRGNYFVFQRQFAERLKGNVELLVAVWGDGFKIPYRHGRVHASDGYMESAA